MLGDSKARRRIQFRTKKNLFVEAGAGTGKTTAMVGRILSMVTRHRKPIHFRNIAAITFTEKAAAELRDRLRRSLEEHVGRYPEQSHLLNDIEQASISTIDSFVRGLLTKFPIESEVPPGFVLLDDIQSTIRTDDWWQHLAKLLLADSNLATAWEAAFENNIKLDRFRNFAKALKNQRRPFLGAWTTEIPTFEQEFVDLHERCVSLAELSQICSDPQDKLLGQINSVLRYYESGHENTLEWLTGLPRPLTNVGSKKGWGESVAEVKSACVAFRDRADRLKVSINAAIQMALIAPILDRIAEAVTEDDDRRRTDGTLEFRDLLANAVRMLEVSESARSKVKETITHVLVDEFQDTDPLQVRFLRLLLEDETGAIPQGSLFVVGDPKQSIYRFRQADMRIYEEVKKTLASEVHQLQTNFRSTPEIISHVNTIFLTLLNSEQQSPYTSLLPNPACVPHQDASVIELIGGPIEGLKADAMRELESETLARALSDRVRNARWHVRIGRTDQFRPAMFKDVTILIRSRTILPTLERALQSQRIPYRIDSRSLLFASQEARTVLSFLQVLADPTDEIALIAVLRSVAGGCSDQDLLEHQGSFDWQNDSNVESIQRVYQTLRKLNSASVWSTLTQLVDQVIAGFRLMESAALHDRPRDAWRRIMILQDLAVKYEQSAVGSLRGFVQYLSELSHGSASVNESVIPEEDDDAVSITTIHASKGLEFPIVVLTGISGSKSNADSVPVIPNELGQLEVRLTSKPLVATRGLAEQKELENTMDLLEQDRLLYVAATRAKDRLVLGCSHDAKKPDASMAGRLWGAIPEELRIPLEHEEGCVLETEARSGKLTNIVELTQKIQNDLSHIVTKPIRSPSTLAREVRDWLKGEPIETNPIRGILRSGGIDLGRAVHSIMQLVDLRFPEHYLPRLVMAQAQIEKQDPDTLLAMARKALDTKTVRNASKGQCWREMFLSANIEGTLIEGYIDLIYCDQDGEYVVVDYKTDAVSTQKEAEKRMEGYLHQAAAYALMIEANLGKAPKEVHFIFLRADAIVLSPDLNLPMSEVREYARELSRKQ